MGIKMNPVIEISKLGYKPLTTKLPILRGNINLVKVLEQEI